MSSDQHSGRLALLEKFRTIAAERLERLNNAIVELERRNDDPALRSLVLREIHTLKGEAKLMGFGEANQLAHRIEDLLVEAQRHDFRMAPERVEIILRGFDLIGLLVSSAEPPPQTAGQVRAYLAAIEDHIRGGAAAAPVVAEQQPPLEAAEPAALDQPGESSIRIEVQRLDTLTERMGDLLRHHLLLDHALLELRQVGNDLRAELQRLRSASLAAQPALIDGRSSALSLPESPPTAAWPATLDQREGAAVAGERPPPPLSVLAELHARLQGAVARTREIHHQSGDTLDELEVAVRDLRLQPISTLFRRFRRAIRDLAHEQGKQVKVTVAGGELELDKHVLDRIAEPLLHLIRNAIDHGIEPPSARRAAGKPEEGRIDLSAVQVGGHAEILVVDDGRGISPAMIRGAALRRGLLDPAEADEISRDALLNLIFSEGFSTRPEASDLSGRGIGLRVVKERVEAMGGAVRASSVEGHGATMVLQVPITVALMRALVVEEQGGFFAFPSHTVSALLDQREVEEVEGSDGRVLRVGSGLVPYRELSQVLGQRSHGHHERNGARIVVLQAQERRVGVRLQRVVGERELVQRPLDPFIEQCPLLIGTALLEYARPTLILNVAEVVRLSDRADRPAGSRTGLEEPRQQHLLVVEDSELTRDMLVSLARRAGQRVSEASNGRDALEQIQKEPPDLLITDLEMPVMDGFQLIEEVRRRSELAHLPIVVLSSRGSPADKQRAAELGADSYLTKSEFSEEALLETIGRFLTPARRGTPA